MQDIALMSPKLLFPGLMWWMERKSEFSQSLGVRRA
jgi:hypothetical protein